ncbi:UPF0149 family protein [Terasakiella sp.]|uniref:UPF0149 family protein n=1 Tax=Terasakiella sp. TaxID=2034861 RepID=UPI003AA7C332
MFEPELIYSSLCQSIEVEGKNLRIEIYKMENEKQWSLEIEHEDGSSLLWDELFDSDFLALNAARQTLKDEGIAAFTNAEEAKLPPKAQNIGSGKKKASPKLSKDLKTLEKFLFSEAVNEDCMSLTELDGYLASIVVCPDMIMPSEWMPKIWGSDDPVFDSMEQAQAITGAIMSRYNAIIKELDTNKYAPILDYDERTKETIWEIWIDGFFRGVALRLDAWDVISEGELGTSFAIFLRMFDLVTKPASQLKPTKMDDKLWEMAPDIIVNTVYEFHEFRKGGSPKPPKPANRNVGRNDPCPCGSGKKFKKCCLH